MTKLAIEADSPAELVSLLNALATGTHPVILKDVRIEASSEPLKGLVSSAPTPEPEKANKSGKTSKKEEPKNIFAEKLAETKPAEQAKPAEIEDPISDAFDKPQVTPQAVAPAESPAELPKTTEAPVAKIDLDLLRKAYGPRWVAPATKERTQALMSSYGHTKLGDFYSETSPEKIKEFYDALLLIN